MVFQVIHGLTAGRHIGRACSICGSRLRYKKSGLCVPCCARKMREQRLKNKKPPKQYEKCAARQRAIDNGEIFYRGKICDRCGGTKRYTISHGCVICHRSAFSRLSRKQRQRRNALNAAARRRARMALEVIRQLGLTL